MIEPKCLRGPHSYIHGSAHAHAITFTQPHNTCTYTHMSIHMHASIRSTVFLDQQCSVLSSADPEENDHQQNEIIPARALQLMCDGAHCFCSKLYSFAAKLRWRYVVPRVRVKHGAINHSPSMQRVFPYHPPARSRAFRSLAARFRRCIIAKAGCGSSDQINSAMGR